ncbi:MAG: class I adenylate cyclase [Gammaproteobacteria bacterium]|nr:class I adenylate cyclase [Gammaproteobacteria bacterium]
MEQQSDATEWFEDVDFRRLKLRFLDVNKNRLQRVQSTFKPQKQTFLHLLPLMFQVNHPSLPGYVSSRCPCGISNYRPDKQVLDDAQTLIRGFTPPRGALREDIHALYLMGSAGTIAFSEKSDLDIWICHDPELDEEPQQLLLQKARDLEKWGESLGLEVHFFLVNADTFRCGNVEDLSAESSGSAQHVLLLEEFYRTSILLEGRYPVWWLIPPQIESLYDDAVEHILQKRFINANEVIDFGGLGNLPSEEFFGAGVWQLSKGINSPYKSALKILLTEAYASEYPQVQLLGMEFKQRVHNGISDELPLDPYLILSERLEQYLSRHNEQRLQLARQAFYLKIRAPLSRTAPAREQWRYDTMREMVDRWGWGKPEVYHLDNRSEWKADVVESERKTVIHELTRSYQALSDFARKTEADSRISKVDLNILGRKLFAAFERKAGKIDIINRGIAKDLSETHLTIHQSNNREGRLLWLLFRGQIPTQDVARSSPLKTASTLIELMCWCYFNDVISPATNLSVFKQGRLYPLEDATAIYKSLDKHFPGKAIFDPDFEDISQPAGLTNSIAFVNHHVPVSELPSSKAVPRGNSNYDAFSFSGLHINLVKRIDWVFTNSWGEIYCFSYFGHQGVKDFLCEYLLHLRHHDTRPVPALTVYPFTMEYASVISGRMETLWRDLARRYTNAKHRHIYRYLMSLEKGYLLLDYVDKSPHGIQIDNQASSLFKQLAAPNPYYRNLSVDRYTLGNMVIPQLYERNVEDKIQLFYMEKPDNKIDIYVLDEKGSLYFHSSPLYNAAILLSHYVEFIGAVLKRIEINSFHYDDSASIDTQLNLYQIKREHGKYVFGARILHELRPHKDIRITAICENSPNNQRSYTIYCGDHRYSSLEHGSALFSVVAETVVTLRKDSGTYPIHISDIDFSSKQADITPAGQRQTSHYLNQKRYLEHQLNKAISSFEDK